MDESYEDAISLKSMMSLVFNTEQFIAAIKKNGYPWGKGKLANDDGTYCAMGQAFKNLGLDDMDLNFIENGPLEGRDFYSENLLAANAKITFQNDLVVNSYEEIAAWAENYLRNNFPPDSIFEVKI